MVDATGLGIVETVQCPEHSRLMMMLSIRSMDAVACVRKYFVEASMARGLYFFIRIGIMASIFISKPTQIMNQWELNRTIIVPKTTVDIMVIRMAGFISMGRG